MEDNTKRLIVMSILAYAIGTFIFAAGLMTKTAVSIILFYIIASILIICGILALYNNYKKGADAYCNERLPNYFPTKYVLGYLRPDIL